MTADSTGIASAPDLENLESAVRVTEKIVAGVRTDQRKLPTPCPDYDVARLLDHLVGFATNFADRSIGVVPAADPAQVRAGDDPQAAYRDATVRLLDGYRDGSAGREATPVGVVLMETVTHGWDLAASTGQPTPYPDAAVEAALSAGQAMMAPRFRGEGQPFGEEVQVPGSAPPLDRLIAFMGRDPGWKA
jgi:uncharacterized protein (TIGR03086 family)